MAQIKPLTGVSMPCRRPSSTTLPANQGSSSRLSRIRSFPIEVVWCGGMERICASVRTTLSDGTLAWPATARNKQYSGNVNVTLGGFTLPADRLARRNWFA